MARALGAVLLLDSGGRLPKDSRLLSEAVVTLQSGQNATPVLDYLHRLYPDDLDIRCALGIARLMVGDARAVIDIEAVARTLDWGELWFLLARVARHFRDLSRAAKHLAAALARFAVPRDSESQHFADQLSTESGAWGWCGLDGEGGLIVSTIWPQLTVKINGRDVETKAVQGAVTEPRRVRLPADWTAGSVLTATASGHDLIGSPVSIERVTAVQGFVEATEDGLRGWCWLPGNSEHVPEITIRSLNSSRRGITVMPDDAIQVAGAYPNYTMQRRFTAAASTLPDGPLSVTGPYGRPLYGSPLDHRHASDQARRGALAARRAWPSSRAPARPGILVVIPVHRNFEVTRACIDSVLAAQEEGPNGQPEILVIADGCPEVALLAWLRELSNESLISLHVAEQSRGFPAAANDGLRRARGRDVVLLNSDTRVCTGWLSRLSAVAHSHPRIGTVTPLSNDATIFSYPTTNAPGALPSAPTIDRLAQLAYATAGTSAVDVPTGHGFCLFIRGDCLRETGIFREDTFAQGYGEENDFCRRAAALRWRNVAAPGVFVGHLGSQSFGVARLDLQRRNLETLNRLHPGYDRLVAQWLKRDPLADYRYRLDVQRLRDLQAGRRCVVLVTHGLGGGVERFVSRRAEDLEQEGSFAIILRPGPALSCRVTVASADVFPNLTFAVPDDLERLVDLLATSEAGCVEIHHAAGHSEVLLNRLCTLGLPYDIVIHDYSWYCPRTTLTSGNDQYCGEPDVRGCTDRFAEYGGTVGEAISPEQLSARSRRWLARARSVTAPTLDTARRITRRFGADVHVRAWEEEPVPAPRIARAAGALRRICVAGAIGPEKGFHTLLRCARRAVEKRFSLEFVLVGYSSDDALLREAGVRITGPYQDDEVVELIREQHPSLAFMPGRSPETWSYVLTHLWRAGLHVVTFDIGAPAERIRRLGGGTLLPLHTPLDQILRVLGEA
ncbi:MAG: glycosyltransferase [Proteobacteria bacterium]|nr:glycosyltransferase [Pseudomonadota bacterium]